MMPDKSILMLINEFPPVGESGVQRPLKFVKYLTEMGWKVWVITPRRLPKGVLDHSLCEEIPASCIIHYTGSLGFGGRATMSVEGIRSTGASQTGMKALAAQMLMTANHTLFPLDKQIGWVPFAWREAVKLIEKHRLRNVYITGFPFSAFLAGIMLKKKYGGRIRWVADYRDAWQFEPLMAERMPEFRMKQVRYWDRLTLRSCDHAVFVTPGIRRQYLDAFPWLKDKCSVITNGYDEDDFREINPVSFEKYTLVYMGKLYNLHRPDLLPLLDAIEELRDPGIQLVHLGSATPEVADRIQSGGYSFYRYIGYKTHREALCHAAGADVNILPVNDDPASVAMFTGKLFELLRTGKPILGLGPKSCVAGDLILRAGAGEYVHLADRAGIIAALDRIRQNPSAYNTDMNVVREYERRVLAAKLAMLYE